MNLNFIHATAVFSLLFCNVFCSDGKTTEEKNAGTNQPLPKLVVLKLDDVVAGTGGQIVPQRWQRVADYLEGKKIKSAMGVIGYSLVNDNPAYFKWITDRAARGYIEFWNHGFRNRSQNDPLGEFEGGYDEQLRALQLTDSLAAAKLGLNLTVWGPHWSGCNEHTDRALAQMPQIRMTLGFPLQAVHYKGIVLSRSIDMEYPTHNPDFETFKKAYQAREFDLDFFFLQGHPASWDETRWDNFVKIIEFLEAEGVRFVTPSELYVILTAKSKPVSWNPEVIEKALAARMIQWKNDPNVDTEYAGFAAVHNVQSLNYLSLVAFYDYDNKYPQAADKVMEQLRFIISGGKEPCCRGTIAGWADNSLAQSITLAKYTPKIWNHLTKDEKEKLDWLMKALAVAGNYCQNSRNNIHRCLYQSFDWRKGWNPNHQEGYVGIMIAAWQYFGGTDKVNQILKNFSYDQYMSKFTEYGFENVKSCWQSTGKTLMENGGTDSGGGTTAGARIPFRYASLVGFGELAYEPALLYRDLALRMFHFTVTSNECDGKAYILDGSKSPYEGREGMCYEFRTNDASGCRSSVSYVYEGWFNNILTVAGMSAFGNWTEGAEKREITNRMMVGSFDMMYKLQHGWRDHRHGKSSEVREQNLAGRLGYEYVMDIFQKLVMPDF